MASVFVPRSGCNRNAATRWFTLSPAHAARATIRPPSRPCAAPDFASRNRHFMRVPCIALCAVLSSATAAQEPLRFEGAPWRAGDVWREQRELVASWKTDLSVEGSVLFDFAEPLHKETEVWEIEILGVKEDGPVEWSLRLPYSPRISMQRAERLTAHIDDLTGIDLRTRRELEALAVAGFPAGRPDHPFERLLAGRAVEIGETIDVAPEIADRLFPQAARPADDASGTAPDGVWKTDELRLRLA